MTLTKENDFAISVGTSPLPIIFGGYTPGNKIKTDKPKSPSRYETYLWISDTSMNTDIRRLERALDPVREKLEQFADEASEVDLETPEIFDLQPLSVEPVRIQIREARAAQFTFAVDDDIDLDDIEL